MMAAEEPHSEEFEDIDWDDVSEGGLFSVAWRTKALLIVLAGMLGIFLYDHFLVGQFQHTFGIIGWQYSPSKVDFMFLLTLVFLVFYGLVPLYDHPRMARYYWKNFKKNRPALISLGFLVAILLIGLFGPIFMDKPEIALFQKYQPPVWGSVDSSYVIQCAGDLANGRCYGSWKYPFGTTGEGKNILNLVVYGMQTSMKIGLTSALLVMFIGSIVGTVAAYSGGLVDEVLMRYVDIQQVLPTFLLFLLIAYIYKPTLFLFIILFGGFTWGNNARYVRSNALQKTEEEYVKASKLTGAKTWHIIRRHLIPNTASSIITDLTLLIPGFILFEAGLSFLGLGDPTVPSWGGVIASGRGSLSYAWWISTIPGVFLFFTILAFNFLGDAILDTINPQADSESEQ